MKQRKILLFLGIALISIINLECVRERAQPLCAPGYTGSNCNIEVVPSRMYINSINVVSFPSRYPDGTFWDVDNGGTSRFPDLQLVVETTGPNPVGIYTSAIAYDADANLSYNFDIVPSLAIIYPAYSYRLTLYDSDGPTADLMGELVFTPYQAGTGFPPILDAVTSNGKCHLQLNVSYSW